MIRGICWLLSEITGTRWKAGKYTEVFRSYPDFLKTECCLHLLIYPAETDMLQRGWIYEQKYK